MSLSMNGSCKKGVKSKPIYWNNMNQLFFTKKAFNNFFRKSLQALSWDHPFPPITALAHMAHDVMINDLLEEDRNGDTCLEDSVVCEQH